jgi:hypothetical protein
MKHDDDDMGTSLPNMLLSAAREANRDAAIRVVQVKKEEKP